MNDFAVSVIMPIYNAEKYLRQSLGCVVNQSLKNIEILCINDGSKDNSLEIIKDFQKKDCRIKLIDQPNGGYGVAMNHGLQAAHGKYIGILEPDDFAELDMFERLYHVAEEYDCDVVKSNYYEYQQNRNQNTLFEVLDGLPYNQITSAYENEKIIHMRPCIWSGIYRRKMLMDNFIVFNETPGASYQDTAFAFKVWVTAQKVVFIQDAFLHYRIDNENSSVNSSGKIFSICDEFQAMQAFLNTDVHKRNKFSKILQVLKLDSYVWNLNRIADKYKMIFRDQMALEFIKAEYEGFLDKKYFDEGRWNQLQGYIESYNASNIQDTSGKILIKNILKKLKQNIFH